MKKKRFRELKQGKTAPKQESNSHSGTRYAPAGLKIKAFITDAFMLLMPILFIVFYWVFDGREDFAAHRLEGWVYILVPFVTVETLFLYKTGQTPGYRAYDLVLIDAKTGMRPSLFAVVFRNLSAILSFFSIIGWLLMFIRKDSKTLHDLLSATAVIYDEKAR